MDSTAAAEPAGGQGVVHDFARDRQVFGVPWGKAMMWIFLLSDTFIFSCFLVGYMSVRISTTDPWPVPSEVFALSFGGEPIPLILIAIMTFILITSSGTMASCTRRIVCRYAGIRVDQADRRGGRQALG